jgi:hypothetical protein
MLNAVSSDLIKRSRSMLHPAKLEACSTRLIAMGSMAMSLLISEPTLKRL